MAGALVQTWINVSLLWAVFALHNEISNNSEFCVDFDNTMKATSEKIGKGERVGFDEQLILAHRDIIGLTSQRCNKTLQTRTSFETDTPMAVSSKTKKSSSKKSTASISEEQYLKIKKREADALRDSIKREKLKDRVVLFDNSFSDLESTTDQEIFDFEEHLIKTGEYPLVMVWRLFVHPQPESGTTIGYYGDLLGMLIAGMGPLYGHLMISFIPESRTLILAELADVIKKIMSLEKVSGMEHLWTTLMSELRKTMHPLTQIPSCSTRTAAHRFLRYLTAATVSHHKQEEFRYDMTLTMDESTLNLIRGFMMVSWKLLNELLLQRLQLAVTASVLAQDGRVPLKLKEMIPSLRDQFKSIQVTVDGLLYPFVNVSAEQLNHFLVFTISGFDNKLALLDSVLSIGQAIHQWRRTKNHGTIAISTAPMGGGSWEINEMLHALGYDSGHIISAQIQYDQMRGYYKTPFIASSPINASSSTTKCSKKRGKTKDRSLVSADSVKEKNWLAYCEQELS